MPRLVVFLTKDPCTGPACITVLCPVLGHVHSLASSDRSESQKVGSPSVTTLHLPEVSDKSTATFSSCIKSQIPIFVALLYTLLNI